MPETAIAAAPERTLPHNLEAEKSVLGAILIHNEAFNHAAELIDSRDFFRDDHLSDLVVDIIEEPVGLHLLGLIAIVIGGTDIVY